MLLLLYLATEVISLGLRRGLVVGGREGGGGLGWLRCWVKLQFVLNMYNASSGSHPAFPSQPIQHNFGILPSRSFGIIPSV